MWPSEGGAGDDQGRDGPVGGDPTSGDPKGDDPKGDDPGGGRGRRRPETTAAAALSELIDAVRRARQCSLPVTPELDIEPITPTVWLYRDGARVVECRCAQASLTDALDLVLNAVPTYGADEVALAFEGPPYPGLGRLGDRTANAVHVVRRRRDGGWHAGCLPYTVEWSDFPGEGPRVDWLDRRLSGLFSSGAVGGEQELQGVVAAALEESFARPRLVTDELLTELQVELDLDAVAARHRADTDVTHALQAVGRGRWSIVLDQACPPPPTD
jgi:hypothetical protein